MNREVKISARQQIRNFLIVLFLGVAFACLGIVFFLYYYGPSGRYVVRNILLSPEVIAAMRYQDSDPQTGEQRKYIFDRIQFSYFDSEKKQWQEKVIAKEAYVKFYEIISGEKSILNPSEELIDLFSLSSLNRATSNRYSDVSSDALHQARMTLFVRGEKDGEKERSKVFQELHFSYNGNYYRIELREDDPVIHWAYFYHPQISQKAMQIFIP